MRVYQKIRSLSHEAMFTFLEVVPSVNDVKKFQFLIIVKLTLKFLLGLGRCWSTFHVDRVIHCMKMQEIYGRLPKVIFDLDIDLTARVKAKCATSSNIDRKREREEKTKCENNRTLAK